MRSVCSVKFEKKFAVNTDVFYIKEVKPAGKWTLEKWDIWVWNEIFEFEMRYLSLKWDIWVWNEIFDFEMRYLSLKWDIWVWNEIFEFEMRYLSLKWDIWVWATKLWKYLDICNFRNITLNLIKTKRRPLYLRTQFLPPCKHFSAGL